MRSFVAPAALFAYASLLIALPGLMELRQSSMRPRPSVDIRQFGPPAGSAGGTIVSKLVATIEPSGQPVVVASGNQHGTFSAISTALPVPFRVVVLASIPVFALVYAIWPRVCKCALDPSLGRRHVMLTVFPPVLMPLALFLAMSLGLPLIVQAAVIFGPARTAVPPTFSLIATVYSSGPYVTGFLWLCGFIVFAINVRTTLRRQRDDG